jgi:hypothetical protein
MVVQVGDTRLGLAWRTKPINGQVKVKPAGELLVVMRGSVVVARKLSNVASPGPS